MKTALRIAEKYGLEIYDTLIAASALEAVCATLYSEDFAAPSGDRGTVDGLESVE